MRVLWTFLFWASIAYAKSSSSSPIVRSQNGTESIGWSEAGCAWEVSSTGPSNLKVSVQSEACDPAAADVQGALVQNVYRLMGKRVGKAGLTFDIYLPHSPTLLTRWGVILKSSDEWEKRRTSPQSSVISDNEFFSKLMDQGQLFGAYQSLFDKLGGLYETVEIDKVVYPPAGDFSFYETALKIRGYGPQDAFPIPLVTHIKLISR